VSRSLRCVPRCLLWLALVVVGAACSSALKPPKDPLRARQTERWTAAITRDATPGDLIASRRYGDEDDALELGLTRVGVLDDQGRIIEAFGPIVTATLLRDLVHGSHRVVVVRPRFVDDEVRARAGKAAGGYVDQAASTVGGVGDSSAARATAFALTVYRAVHPPASASARLPIEIPDVGALVFDSGPRF
jgi:hypothetical protein